jgi:hypothetical protein
MTPLTLYEALATLPDPRSRHGRIHPLPAVVGLVALALLMGRKSPDHSRCETHRFPLAFARRVFFASSSNRAVDTCGLLSLVRRVFCFVGFRGDAFLILSRLTLPA